jgi:hypothetical protein
VEKLQGTATTTGAGSTQYGNIQARYELSVGKDHKSALVFARILRPVLNVKFVSQNSTFVGFKFVDLVSREIGSMKIIGISEETTRENVWSAAGLQGEVWSRDKSAEMYSAFGWRLVLLAMMNCTRVCPSKSLGRLKTIFGTRLQARRCDCSFVLAAPMQTSVGNFSRSGGPAVYAGAFPSSTSRNCPKVSRRSSSAFSKLM